MNLRDAVANLIKVKGRHNTEIAYQKLIEAFDAPEKKWVGLTDEEIAEGIINSWVIGQAFESAVWWAEEKLKEKNSD